MEAITEEQQQKLDNIRYLAGRSVYPDNGQTQGISYKQWLLGLAMQALIPLWIDSKNGNTCSFNVAQDAKTFVDAIIESQIE
jgi:hypothetical protein